MVPVLTAAPADSEGHRAGSPTPCPNLNHPRLELVEAGEHQGRAAPRRSLPNISTVLACQLLLEWSCGAEGPRTNRSWDGGGKERKTPAGLRSGSGFRMGRWPSAPQRCTVAGCEPRDFIHWCVPWAWKAPNELQLTLDDHRGWRRRQGSGDEQELLLLFLYIHHPPQHAPGFWYSLHRGPEEE